MWMEWKKWIVCLCVCVRERIGFDDMNKSAAHLFVWQPNIKWLKQNNSIAYEKYPNGGWFEELNWQYQRVWNENENELPEKKEAKKEITKSNQWFNLETETETNRQKKKENEIQEKWKLHRTNLLYEMMMMMMIHRRQEKRSAVHSAPSKTDHGNPETELKLFNMMYEIGG